MALFLKLEGDMTILIKDILNNSKLIESTFGKFLRSFASMKFQNLNINKSLMTPIYTSNKTSNMNAIFTKSRVLFIILFFSVISSFSQANGDYRSVATGNWGALATWQQFNGTTWVTPTTAPTSASGVITIQSPNVVTVAANVSTDQTTINTGGQVNVSSGFTLTIANGTGTDLTVDGIISNAGTITTTGATMAVNTGGIYKHNFTTTAGTIPTATWNSGSKCEIIGYTSLASGSTPGGLGQTFSNFTWNCSAQANRLIAWATSMVVNGTYTVQNTNASYIYFTNGGNITFSIAGNLTVSGGELRFTRGNGNATVAISGNVNVTSGILTIDNGDGGSSLTISGDLSATAGTFQETAGAPVSVIFNKAGTQTFTSGGAFSGFLNFIVNSGSTLQMAAAGTVVSGDGTFTLSSGATLGITSIAGITTSGGTGNIQVIGTRTYSTGANYIYNGSANQAVGNGLTQNTPANLTITNPGFTVSLGAITNISGILTVNAASTLALTNFDLGATTAPTAVNLVSGSSSSASITGTTGTLTLGGDITVTFSGSGTSGAIISSKVNLGAANRNFDIASGVSLDLTISGDISGSRNITKAGTGRLVLSGANTYTGTTTINVGTIQLGHTSALGTIAGGTSVTSGAELDLAGFTLSTSEPLTLNGTGIADGALFNSSATGATFNGAITLGSNTEIEAGAGDITLGTSGIIGGFNLTKSGSFNLSLGNSTSTLGAVTVTAGTLTAPGTVNISGDFTNNGTFSAGSGTVNLNSASAQTITGSSASTFNNLTLSGGGAKSLSKSATVSGVLTFTSGILTSSSTNLLSITSTGSVTTASDASFVDGPVAKTGTSSFVFPVGKTGTGYQAIAIASLSGSETFTAEYVRASTTTYGNGAHQNPIVMVSACELWLLARTGSSVTADVTLYGNQHSGCSPATGDNYFRGNSANISDMRVIHWNGTEWTAASTSTGTPVNSGTGATLNVQITALGVSNFSPFSFGSIGLSPLPVKLVSFTAHSENNNSILNWSTATEKNNDYFEIERSVDGTNFNNVGKVAGAGNSTSILNYQFIDTRVSELSSKQVYYRLKQVDFDGTIDYSNIVLVNFNKVSAVTIQTIQPNPFGDKLSVSYSLPENGVVTISLVDLQGRVLLTSENNANKGFNTANFNTEGIATGMYFITINHLGMSSNYKMLVKK